MNKTFIKEYLLNDSNYSIELDSILNCIPANELQLKKNNLKTAETTDTQREIENVRVRLNYWKSKVGHNDKVHFGWEEETKIDAGNLSAHEKEVTKIRELFDDKR